MSMNRKQYVSDYCRRLPPQRRPWDAPRIERWLLVTMAVAGVCLALALASAGGWVAVPRILERLGLQ